MTEKLLLFCYDIRSSLQQSRTENGRVCGKQCKHAKYELLWCWLKILVLI